MPSCNEVDRGCNITLRENEQTSIWSYVTRKFGKTLQEAKQMSVMKMLAVAETEIDPTPMTAISTTGAASHSGDGWHAIEWRKVHQNVRRLQARIVKAIQAKRWGKVKALQHLLTRSFSGKAIAVKRVTENRGKRTSGIDGVLWKTPEDKIAAVRNMRQRGYRAQPLRRIHIPKSSGNGKRPLSIPVMADRAMQSLYLLALDPLAETRADPNSYGFRKVRSPADALQQCFNVLAQKTSAQWILEGDIKSCFDEIDFGWLRNHIPLEKPLLNQWLSAGFVDQQRLHPSMSGVPQGGTISPAIMNLTLDGLEPLLRKQFPRRPGHKVNLVRFADDLIITGSSRELLEQQVKPLLTAFLAERGLRLSEHKTHVTHIDDGFDFLGQNIRKYNGTLLIKPAKSSVKSILTKIKQVIRKGRQAPTDKLIAILNPIIRGWANYHRHVVSKRTFATVDHLIFQMLWRWARRRHPNKAAQWVKDRYFRSVKGRKWVFFADVKLQDGKTRRYTLIKAADTPIRRHVKIRESANPYDPAWEPYFEQRLDQKMQHDLERQHKPRTLWRSQRGRCLICDQMITKQSGWHTHHIVWRSHGGDDTLDNLVLLHPNCHQQVHSQRLSVVKPRPVSGRS